MTKILNKVEIEGSGCNTIKVIYEKSTSNIIVISENLKTSKIQKTGGSPKMAEEEDGETTFSPTNSS